ncbi:MAG: hypothetical protein NTV72_01880 [Candidatus Taylorbacteria bacterium]|nr:hypothetical protein [Candidatus Taylorbacteria bacterium]
MEPIFAMEVPIVILLSALIINEYLSPVQIILIITLLIGVFLISNKSLKNLLHIRWEKGVLYALITMLGMGFVNFLFGIGARAVNPLFLNWFTDVFLLLACTFFITIRSEWHKVRNDWKNSKKLIFGVSVSDKVAWIAYSTSTLFIPIGLAIGITESYIALAAVLGLIFNKEKLVQHQYLGLFICITSVIILSFLN